MRRLVPAESAGQLILDLLLRVAAVLVAELNADARGALTLRALRGHPDHAARDRELFFLTHEIEQHEHFVAEPVIAVGRDEKPAVLHERHVGEVERTLVLDRERQQTRFVTWTSHFLTTIVARRAPHYVARAARPVSNKLSSASC